jgi:hypothetical protein
MTEYEIKTETRRQGGQHVGMGPRMISVRDPDSGITISIDNIFRIGRSQTRTINNFKDAIELLKSCH